MKIALLFVAAVLCIQGSHAFFYGANIQLPQSGQLSTTIRQCATTADIIVQKLCQINKKALKFNTPNFQTFANFLADIQYVLQSLKEFYDYFLNCLNDQTAQVTADVSIRNIRVLIYQLQNYVLTGFANNFFNSAASFGATFGCNYQQNIGNLAQLMVQQFGTVLVSLNQLAGSFEAIAASGQPITAVSLNATLNTAAFSNMLTAMQAICTASTTYSTILDGIWTSVSSLESIIVAIDASGVSSNGLVGQAEFFLDIANQAAKKNFADKIASYMYTIDVSMAQFVSLAGRLYVGDSDVIAYRQILETYVGSLRLFLDNINNAFALLLTNNMRALTQTVTNLQAALGQVNILVKGNLQNGIAATCGPIGTCFVSNTPLAAKMTADLGFNASQCISQQTTVSTQAVSLLGFIVEDVVIEALGVIDRMCSCAVAGDPTTVRRSKVCMQTVTTDLVTANTGLLGAEIGYLQTEFAGVQTVLGTALGTLGTCMQNLFANFELSYTSFNSKVNVCLIG